jgi:hypothetical protein
VYIPPRTQTKIVEIEGPGVITHIWIPFGPDPSKRVILRMFWDGEKDPSVEVPLADFFGVALGQSFNYQSAMTNAAPLGGFNCYFPMPFEKSALVTVTHDDDEPIERLYFHVDYLALTDPLPGAGRFHAQYRQNGDGNNRLVQHAGGSLEHTVVQAEGLGHFAGLTYSLSAAAIGDLRSLSESVSLNLDGNRQMVLDDGARFLIGPEYLNPHTYSLTGRPYVMLDGGNHCGRFSRYRWFLEGPPSFKRTFESRLLIRHGSISDLRIYSVGYWYQKEPHNKFPALPPAAARTPPMGAASAGQARS